MSFVIVDYKVTLTREEVISLILDNKSVETITTDGEMIVIMGTGTHKKVPDRVNGGISHIFDTNVEFKDHGKSVWSTITLSSKDRQLYLGHITRENPRPAPKEPLDSFPD